MVLNDFFSDAVINLKIPKFENSDPFSENIDHPLRTTVKYRKHPSISQNLLKNLPILLTRLLWKFHSKKSVCSKAIQATDIPVKVIKGKSIFLAEQKCAFFIESISKQKFPNFLQLANITPGFKKGTRTSKYNYRPVSILPMLSKIF